MSEKNPFGDFLKNYRSERSLSTNDLHRMTGVSQPYLSQIENGKKPSIKIIEKISAGLGLNYFQLMKIAGYMKKEDSEDLIKRSSERRQILEQVTQELPLHLQHFENLTEEFKKLKSDLSLCDNQKEATDILNKLQKNLENMQEAEKMFEYKKVQAEQLRREIEAIHGMIESALDYEEVTQIQNVIEEFAGNTENEMELENLFATAQEIYLSGRKLSDQEKEKALQILKLAFDVQKNYD